MSDETTLQGEQGGNEAVVSQPLNMQNIPQQPPAPNDNEILAWQAQPGNQPVTPELLARQAIMIEDYQRAEASNSAYNSIIEQQQAQIAALMAQNDALNQQVTRMVQGGAQFNQQSQQVGQNWAYTPQQPNTAQQFAQGALSNGDDWSLEALGKEIGKQRREV